MKSYLIKMVSIVLVISSFLIISKNNNDQIITNNYIENSIAFSGLPKSRYDDLIVYDGLSKNELSAKINKVLNSTLTGYGKTIVDLSLAAEVDPYIATSIIMVETGCKWNCSYLVKHCNNVGGMKGKGCGSYGKFATLESGLDAFITNLSKGYFKQGLTTPEAINHKYAENPNWHNDVNYYLKLIKAS